MTIRSIILVKIWNVSRAVACTHREILACNSANSVKSARPRRTRTRIDVVFSLNELWRIFWTPALPFSNGAVTGPVRLPIFSSSTMSPVCNMSPVHSSPVELPLRHSIDRTVDLAASVELDRSMVILMVRWVKVRSFVLREKVQASVSENSLFIILSLRVSLYLCLYRRQFHCRWLAIGKYSYQTGEFIQWSWGMWCPSFSTTTYLLAWTRAMHIGYGDAAPLNRCRVALLNNWRLGSYPILWEMTKIR